MAAAAALLAGLTAAPAAQAAPTTAATTYSISGSIENSAYASGTYSYSKDGATGEVPSYRAKFNGHVELVWPSAVDSAWIRVTYDYLDWFGQWHTDGRVDVEPVAASPNLSVRAQWSDDKVANVRFNLCYLKDRNQPPTCVRMTK
ncbi:hypothetical protein [Streptomyces griseocarneus]|uniref:hypothetical protein n=1 Tax=Streptomyces griseocarneus TaxID=51201 RepID=UPI00167F0409|nr:hypothetical protein [Streptomyces griseocarneus]MBZ6475168.1 hypothetical protein [Streptomyces griseocarneus]GHG61870.1 hypothetical protein GCM10018779_30120 [Streptomyces griseocarneus]